MVFIRPSGNSTIDSQDDYLQDCFLIVTRVITSAFLTESLQVRARKLPSIGLVPYPISRSVHQFPQTFRPIVRPGAEKFSKVRKVSKKLKKFPKVFQKFSESSKKISKSLPKLKKFPKVFQKFSESSKKFAKKKNTETFFPVCGFGGGGV